MTWDPEAWARLGRALRTARGHRGLTQQNLAKLAGVSARAVQDAEGGAAPKRRMPYTIGRIAASLGWEEGAVDAVLNGADLPGDGWQSVPVTQQQLSEEAAEGIITSAMVRATEHATSAEIRAATKIVLDEFRRRGLIVKTDGVQPRQTRSGS